MVMNFMDEFYAHIIARMEHYAPCYHIPIIKTLTRHCHRNFFFSLKETHSHILY